MRPSLLLVALALAASSAGGAEGAPDPVALVEAAIEAHGGTAALERWADLHYAAQATFYFGASAQQSAAQIWVRGGTMLRREAMLESRGSRRQVVSASTGRAAWQRRGSRVYDLPPDDFDTWLAHQPPVLLRARAAGRAALAWIGRLDVDGAAVDVLELSEAGSRTRIALDATTHRVAALEYTARANRGEGKTEDEFVKKTYADYRPSGGVPFPHRLVEYSDGVKSQELIVTEVTIGEAPEAALFAKPEAEAEAYVWSDQLAN